MTISDFDKRVLIEQVRYLEMEHLLEGDALAATVEFPRHTDIDERLWLRARFIVNHTGIQAGLDHAARLWRRANAAALIVAALFGALATFYAVSGSHTINIYWLLLVLLGFNLLSMLLWLAGVSLNLEGLTAGVLAKLTSWLPARLDNGSSITSVADRAWVACNFGGRVGKWQLSTITHQFWLVYLLAGVIVLVLALMARQYDFVWGTTLLSDAAFVKLTDLLSVPLQALGLTTPSAEEVHETRIGVTQALTAAHRYSWAQFLLGALVCFGVLPRLLLWFWSMLMRRLALRRFSLDHYLPYYIGLRQQLMPMAGHGQIIDTDAAPLDSTEAPVINPVSQILPAEVQWVSVEIGDDIAWPPLAIAAKSDFGQVTDRDSLLRILQQLRNETGPALAVAVAAARAPDRGVQRTIGSLLSKRKERWLVLLQSTGQDAISQTRLAAWYRLAKACQVPADHVVTLNVT